MLNQRAGGGATAQARDLLQQAAEHGFETSYHPSGGDEDPAALVRNLDALRPDVVHAHCFYNTWPPGLLKTLASKWPVALTLHDVYAVNQYGTECWECYRNPFCWACPALPVPKRWYSVYRVRSRRERERAWRGLDAHVIYPTEWMRRRMSRIGLARLPGSVIRLGVDSKTFAPNALARKKLGWDDDTPLILSVGSMYSADDDRKGFSVLLESFSRHVLKEIPAAKLVIVGKVFGIASGDRVLVKDAVGRDELALWYAAADVFTLPSLGDNAPVAVLEAMASATPVVATRVGGIPEEVESGLTGLLVPPRDPVTLGAALVRMLLDPELRRSLGAAGRNRVVTAFGRDRAWAEHEALYRRLASRRR